MRRFLLPSVVLVALVGAPLPAAAAPPTTAKLTISLRKSPITFGQSTSISGSLKDTTLNAAVPVTLQSNAAPFTGGFQDAGTTTTDTNGNYRFDDVKPDLTTRYRTKTTIPDATSVEVLVEVRMKVTLRTN